MAAGVGEDLFELRRLLSDAKRPRVRRLLEREIEELCKAPEAEVTESQADAEQQSAGGPKQSLPPQQVKSGAVLAFKSLGPRYSTLSTFSWDQTSDKVKVYYPLEGASDDKVSASFQSSSFDIKVDDVSGKYYRCGIPKLHKNILPDKSKVVVRPKRIIVTLEKREAGNWPDLHKKEDKLKSSLAKEDKDKNPMAGVMDLMKNMYEEGDDNMKRTIAQAWQEARKAENADARRSLKSLQRGGLDDL